MTDFSDLDEPAELADALRARWAVLTESERNALRDIIGRAQMPRADEGEEVRYIRFPETAIEHLIGWMSGASVAAGETPAGQAMTMARDRLRGLVEREAIQ